MAGETSPETGTTITPSTTARALERDGPTGKKHERDHPKKNHAATREGVDFFMVVPGVQVKRAAP